MSPEALIITSMVAETDKCTHEAAVSEYNKPSPAYIAGNIVYLLCTKEIEPL